MRTSYLDPFFVPTTADVGSRAVLYFGKTEIRQWASSRASSLSEIAWNNRFDYVPVCCDALCRDGCQEKWLIPE
jgi:hypothetical protein